MPERIRAVLTSVVRLGAKIDEVKRNAEQARIWTGRTEKAIKHIEVTQLKILGDLRALLEQSGE